MLLRNESYLQILDAVEDLVFVKGPESRLVWANRAFCRHYGMTNEQLRGMIDAPFNAPDFTEQYVRDDAYVFSTGKSIEILEEPVYRHDGMIRLFHTVKSPIFDANNNVVMMVGISRDVTERRESDNKLKAERARTMYAAKMASLGEMAAGVAHEINNPLTVISGLAEVNSELLEETNPDLQRIANNMAAIERTARKLAKIVSGLRAFSRDGKSDPFLPVRLGDVIEDTLAFSKERIALNSIELQVIHSSPSPMIECRATQIGQVVLNLLNNACDAIAEQPQKWIKIETRADGDFVELSVTNSGPPISKEVRDKLFSPFFTTKDIGKGTGLGLSISKGIIENHNGVLFLDQNSPHTRFVFRLKEYHLPQSKQPNPN
ncbi:MAG: PAS domain-containing protein [Bdellovibrionales bacterium]|nr:PAS domain-containing protein [Bdellovibrionales bacterium]